MNGDETVWMWSVGLITFALGLAAGYAIHFFLNADNKRSEALAQELEKLKDDTAQYRGEVAEHFERTSELVQDMTSSYKKVYEHLASSSAKLCGDAIQEPQLDFAAQDRISGNGSDTESATTHKLN